MSDIHRPDNNERDGRATGLLLCAWLDRELPPEQASELESRLTGDAQLRAQADDFKRVDALLSDWYQAADLAPAEKVRVTPALPHVSRRRKWPLIAAGIVALLLVAVAIPLLQGRSAMALAEEVISATGRALRNNQGMLATFTAKIIKHKDADDETRTATGEIKYGPLFEKRLVFHCKETWDATADEPALKRDWAQTLDGQWMTEQQGNSKFSHSITSSFDAETGASGALSSDRADGSPVDVRTRQAVEGLAVLVRSFRQDSFMKWMGLAWKFSGGDGSPANPWSYTTQPESGRDTKLTWTLKIVKGPDSLIKGMELGEDVSNTASGKQISSMNISYTLTFRDQPWERAEFEPTDPALKDQ